MNGLENADLRLAMIVLAIATPLVAGLWWLSHRAIAREAGRPPVRAQVRNAIILALAGPVNLLVWLLFNGWLDRLGSRSIAGYILAGLVFIVVGSTTGFFARHDPRRRRSPRPEE